MPNSALESLYYRMPIALQNGVFSLFCWNLARRRYNRFFHAQLARLKEMEWWSAERIENYQNSRISEIVRHAYETVPFYRRWYDEEGVRVDTIRSKSDLARLPVLTKQMVRENQHDMVSTAFERRSLVRGLTSGTTGTPLNIYLTCEGLAFQRAVWWRHKARFGLIPKDRHLTFGARVPIDQGQKRPPYWRHDYLNNRVYLSTYHISERTVHDIATYLNKEHFDFYTGYPSAMYTLASLMEQAGLRLLNRPKQIVTGADALLSKHVSVMTRVFGAPVTEQYGMVEFAGNMSRCEHGMFHEDFECCVVEAQRHDRSGSHNLLLTGWGNAAMPFIRYEVGDFGVPVGDTCACGRESAGFVSIDGRLEDYVITPDGRQLIGMNQVFEYAENAREMQLYQRTRNEVEFRIVAGEGFGDKDVHALIREFHRRAGIDDITVTISLVDQIRKSPAGKLRAVVSEVHGNPTT